jgi:hypothetical protein
MSRNLIRRALLAAMVTAVLCAGTVSARQLRQSYSSTVCRGFCGKNLACPNVLGCACVLAQGFSTGTCQLIAARPGK